MRYIFFLVAAILHGHLTRLPDEFTVSEKFFSLNSSFDICTEYGSFAYAKKHLFSLTSNFELEDSSHETIATAKERFFSWGTVADVFDPEGDKIGWIEENLFVLFSWSEYKIFNRINQLIAVATMNFLGTEFEIHDPDYPEIVYATISRPFFTCLTCHWTVQIKDREVFESGLFDPRLLVLLAICQTDKENRMRLQKAIHNQLGEDCDAWYY